MKTKRPKAIIAISSYRGICVEAIHFYGTLKVIPEYETFELRRPVTKEELDTPGDRFLGYDKGDTINAFSTWRDVIDAGAEMAKEQGLDLEDVFVEGIPNTPRLKYYDAIKPLDTRLRCKKCKKVIEKGEGVYNTPDGVFCVKCYKRK